MDIESLLSPYVPTVDEAAQYVVYQLRLLVGLPLLAAVAIIYRKPLSWRTWCNLAIESAAWWAGISAIVVLIYKVLR